MKNTSWIIGRIAIAIILIAIALCLPCAFPFILELPLWWMFVVAWVTTVVVFAVVLVLILPEMARELFFSTFRRNK